MGIGDSIKNAAENAMKDLGGTAEPHDDGHLPEPGAADEDIKVHSTISEASNTMEAAEDGHRSGQPSGHGGTDLPAQGASSDAGTEGNILPGDGGAGTAAASGTSAGAGPAGAGQAGAGPAGEGTAVPPGDVPGPGGLPDPDPDVLRADPTEADKDPSTGMGRG